jgi:hypothetical protein
MKDSNRVISVKWEVTMNPDRWVEISKEEFDKTRVEQEEFSNLPLMLNS